MSILNYNTQLQSNNVDLQAILDAVNNLPEASTGVELPKLTNPGTATDLAEGKEFIDENGNVVAGTVRTYEYDPDHIPELGYVINTGFDAVAQEYIGDLVIVKAPADSDFLIRENALASIAIQSDNFGDAASSNVLEGSTFSSESGIKVTGTMPNNGTIASIMDGIDVKSVTIPEGYTSGGTVTLDDTIDNEVDTQADLIAQITSALEGKASGAAGEDVTQETLAYTNKLTELEVAIESLETELQGKAGNDSSIEIYSGTISITTTHRPDLDFLTLFYTDKNLELQTIELSGMQYNFDVVKNTVVLIKGSAVDISNSRGCVILGGGYGEYPLQIIENGFLIGV